MTRRTDLDRAMEELSKKRDSQRKGANKFLVHVFDGNLDSQLRSQEEVYETYDRTMALFMELFLYLDKYREKSTKELQAGYTIGWQKVVPAQITEEALEINRRVSQLAKNLGAEVK